MNIADDLVNAFNDGYRQGKIDAVVQGRWIMDTDPDDGDCRCSRCHACIDALHRRNHKRLKLLGYDLHTYYKYCPNCGASMMDAEEGRA